MLAHEDSPFCFFVFQKGDFVLDKKDLEDYENFPIWKIDAGRLLQKYEAVHKDGRLLHKSMSTVSEASNTSIFHKNLPHISTI